MKSFSIATLLVLGTIVSTGCRPRQTTSSADAAKVGQLVQRQGDEIVAAGHYFHIGTPVVLWTDPGGYDAYRVERRFAPIERSSYAATTQEVKAIDSPNRYGIRKSVLSDEEFEQVRGGGWPLELLQDRVDQFVIHYDVAGTSRNCFNILHDQRNLSVQFMLDIDGTIYQTLDLKERAWHASDANSRSIGIEIANMGAYPLDSSAALLKQWYLRLPDGRSRITIPARLGNGGVRTPAFVGYPARPDPVYGFVQYGRYRQYDFTPQQYESLIKLTAALCTIFPKITCDYPRQKQAIGPAATRPTTEPVVDDPTTQPTAFAAPNEPGFLITHALTPDQQKAYRGVLGHYHVSRGKQDPGPAFQWDYVINSARQRMGK